MCTSNIFFTVYLFGLRFCISPPPACWEKVMMKIINQISKIDRLHEQNFLPLITYVLWCIIITVSVSHDYPEYIATHFENRKPSAPRQIFVEGFKRVSKQRYVGSQYLPLFATTHCIVNVKICGGAHPMNNCWLKFSKQFWQCYADQHLACICIDRTAIDLDRGGPGHTNLSNNL